MIERLIYVCESWDYRNYFEVASPDWEIDSFLSPGAQATFIRRNPTLDVNEWAPDRQVLSGTFGFPLKRLNADGSPVCRPLARIESVQNIAPFCKAWHLGQRCIIPVHGYFRIDTCPVKGKKFRRVSKTSLEPMGIAGIWCSITAESEGDETFFFAMLTVNADHHPIIRQFRDEYAEKRMPLILSPEHYEAWLERKIQMPALLNESASVGLTAYPAFHRPRNQYL